MPFHFNVEREVKHFHGLGPRYYTELPVRVDCLDYNGLWIDGVNAYDANETELYRLHRSATITGTSVPDNNLAPYAFKLGVGFNDVPFCTNPYNIFNIMRGFDKRINPLMPVAVPERLDELRIFVQDWLVNNLKPLPKYDSPLEVFYRWLSDNHSYSMKRKTQMLRSFMSLQQTPLNESDMIVKSFIKREFYPEKKHVRLINSRSDRFKAAVGGWMHLIETEVYKDKHFVKHRPVTELPAVIVKLMRFRYLLETDYTSFESGFSPEYMDCVECALWRYMLSNNPIALSQVLLAYYQVVNIFDPVTRRRVPYLIPRINKLKNKRYNAKVVGDRMSGEMWTSLANGFSNLMNILFIAHRKGIILDGLIEGDDGIFGMDSPGILEEDFEELGFRIKMEYGSDLSHTSFCGNVFDIDELKLIISPEQSARLFWSCAEQYIHSKKKRHLELLRAKAMSLYCLGKHTPIASVLSLKVLELIGDGGIILEPGNAWWEKNLLELHKNEVFKPVEITYKSRALYENKFKIPISDQLDIEKAIKSAKCLDDLCFDYWLMDKSMVSGLY